MDILKDIITVWRLGFFSIFRVYSYKYLVKFRLHPVVFLKLRDLQNSGGGPSRQVLNYDFEHFFFF